LNSGGTAIIRPDGKKSRRGFFMRDSAFQDGMPLFQDCGAIISSFCVRKSISSKATLCLKEKIILKEI
jgi:hypothetical protein